MKGLIPREHLFEGCLWWDLKVVFEMVRYLQQMVTIGSPELHQESNEADLLTW